MHRISLSMDILRVSKPIKERKHKRMIAYVVIKLRNSSDIESITKYLQEGWTMTHSLCGADITNTQAFVKYE